MRAGQGLGTRAIAALLAIAATLALVGPTAASPGAPLAAVAERAVAGSTGLRVESTTTYTLDLAATTVRVRYDVTLTNQSPDVVSGGFIRQRFFPEYRLGVLAEATNIVATKADGTSLSVRTEATESPRFTLAIADLVPNLFHPNSQTLSITYDLPRLAPRSEGLTRFNEAFATFPAYGVGDAGLTTVEVRIPDGLQVELIGNDMARTEVDGFQVYRAEAIADPESFFVDVVARDDDKLVRRVVEVGDAEVVVLGWPDDPEWADFVADTVSDGVPVLADLIGLAWPAADQLEVVETVAPYLYGYAGWYQPSASLIEVGDQLDAQVILHELSHLWFNDALFSGRWINEALAEEFSTQALEVLGEEAGDPAPVDSGGPGALRLNLWGQVDLQSGDTQDQEAYGYNASWAGLRRIVDEVGLAPVAAAVQVADAHHLPYGAATVDNTLRRVPDWRTLLDLLEEVAGSTTAEQMFRDLVVTAEQAPLLDERAAMREEYQAVVAAGDGWSPPAELRALMSDWDFAAAEGLVPEVIAVLEVRDDLAAVLDEVALEVPTVLQATFEASNDVADLAEVVGEALTAGVELREAHLERRRQGGPLVAVGLLFSSVDADLDAAVAALAAGEYDLAAERAAQVQEEVAGAATAGALRLMGVAVLVGAVATMTILLRRRRAVVPPPAPDHSGWPRPEGSEADGAEGVGRPADGGGQAGM